MNRAAVACLFALAPVLGAGACTPDHELTDAELYSKYCSECHGADGRGDESLLEGGQEVDLLISQHIADGDREFVHRRIAYGYKQMPAYRDKVEPETLQRLVELTMRLASEEAGQSDDRSENQPPDNEPPDENEPSEDGDHGSTTSESGLSEARSAR